MIIAKKYTNCIFLINHQLDKTFNGLEFLENREKTKQKKR